MAIHFQPWQSAHGFHPARCAGLVLIAFTLAGGWGSASGQTTSPPPPRSPEPSDARAPVPAPALAQTLRDYKPAQLDAALRPWPQSNRKVQEAGGWRAYAKEAAAAAASAAASSPPAAPDHHEHPRSRPSGAQP